MFDNHVNFAVGTVLTPPSPATTGTELTLAAGQGDDFLPNMPLTLFPGTQQPTKDNAEIAYITAVDGDVLTIIRAQEDTTAKTVDVGWAAWGTITAKTIKDIEDSISQGNDASFTQDFTNSAEVTVNHNLGKYPSVSITDSALSEIVGDVSHTDTNTLVVRFSASFTGTIICN